jgi:hypothetical protein
MRLVRVRGCCRIPRPDRTARRRARRLGRRDPARRGRQAAALRLRAARLATTPVTRQRRLWQADSEAAGQRRASACGVVGRGREETRTVNRREVCQWVWTPRCDGSASRPPDPRPPSQSRLGRARVHASAAARLRPGREAHLAFPQRRPSPNQPERMYRCQYRRRPSRAARRLVCAPLPGSATGSVLRSIAARASSSDESLVAAPASSPAAAARLCSREPPAPAPLPAERAYQDATTAAREQQFISKAE